jgi:hypothetical protein
VQAKCQAGGEKNLSTFSKDLRYLLVAHSLRQHNVKLSTPLLVYQRLFPDGLDHLEHTAICVTCLYPIDNGRLALDGPALVFALHTVVA